MANTIKIKRRPLANGAGVPNLAAGELAFSEADAKLFYGLQGGTDVAPIEIGGSGYVLNKISENAPTKTGSGATGTWNISVTGNAGSVTNGVYTTSNQTVGGVKTFSNRPVFNSGINFKDIANNQDATLYYVDDTDPEELRLSTSSQQEYSVAFIQRGLSQFGLSSELLGELELNDVARLSDITNTKLNELAAPTGDVSLNSRKITNLATPTSGTDAATKAYVDAARSGLDVKQSVRVATTQAFDAGLSVTYSGGNTISGTNVGIIPVIDGVTLANGNRILVKNETGANLPYNGIYTVSSVGGAGSPWILTRATDSDSNDEVTAGMFTFVAEGSTNADSGWVLTTNDTITLGTTNLAFAQFSGAGQIIAVSGLVKNGNNIGLATAYGDTINPFASKTQRTVLAAPTGAGGGAPSFRSLVAEDLPSIGNISNAGAIGSTSNRPIITTTNGVLAVGEFGTGVNTFCQGNDSRLSDTRNTTNSLTINNGGVGDASGSTFNGSVARTISYNSIGAPSISGANATGTWNISISGNAATVTNGVYITGSYSDPAWITSLAKSKVGLGNVENTALSTWLGSTNITTLGTVTSGTWSATTIAVDKGGTGQTSYTNGQLLIGNSTGDTLTKATLTQGSGIVITNGAGSITINHEDTSSLTGAQGGNGISSITLDGFGHVTAVGTATYLTSASVCAAIADCPIDGGTF
jgi:hypothetical protein